ncbi:hypothetical protein [Kineococcus aurantiacus]|uniref:Uncharacterized protein n=1 Tax=Kineococcus aurantiacus TaxID=37633 RepID=A0A7Y9DQI3_9ACTN|nr:hypothetical protein [Kineococcus aurantiacus]NYD24945.1 hypothetical protein [Kineococcus aurantiacus]
MSPPRRSTAEAQRARVTTSALHASARTGHHATAITSIATDAAGAGGDPAQRLAAMTDAYVDLVTDRDLLVFQVHTRSAADLPEVHRAPQRGPAVLVGVVEQHGTASPAAIQHSVAHGRLCHLVVTADLDALDTRWAQFLTAGVEHLQPSTT